MALLNFKPSRSQAECRVVADLDKLIVEPVAFRFQNKVYELKPVETRTFMRIAEQLGKIQELIKNQSEGSETSEDQIYEAYFGLINPLCSDFKFSQLKVMTLPQVHGLINLIIKHATGQPMNMDQTGPDDEKKNSTKRR